MSNNLIVGYTSNDESRARHRQAVPVRRHPRTDGTAYMSFGSEPFTANNELRYKTFQLQDNFTKFGTKHSLTFGAHDAALPIGERVLELLPAEQLHLQLAGRTSTPTRTTTWPTRTGRRRPSRCAVSRCAIRTCPARKAAAAAEGLVQRRVRAGRMAAAPQPDGDGGRPVRRVGVREHGVSQRERRCADVPR